MRPRNFNAKTAKTWRGKAATKSLWPVPRAEAQSAQRKNFAKIAQFFGIALQRILLLQIPATKR
jgi:hypothetical protein